MYLGVNVEEGVNLEDKSVVQGLMLKKYQLLRVNIEKHWLLATCLLDKLDHLNGAVLKMCYDQLENHIVASLE